MNCKRETNKIVSFLIDYFKRQKFKKAIIGISGGLDSAVVCDLLVKALGKENVIPILLAYHEQKDYQDSLDIIKHLKLNYNTKENEINIGTDVDSIAISLDLQPIEENYLTRISNIKARVRMIMLYDLSMKYNALVVGTTNRTELVLGYFTVYGDGACAVEPIAHLYKTQVKKLAKYLEIPEKIINKAPSAGLFEGQTDEKDLGATYKEIDEILPKMNIRDIMHQKFDMEVKDLYSNLRNRIKKNWFKLFPPQTLR